MKHYRGILFDLDNTLLDRTRTFERFVQTFIARYFGEAAEAEKREIMRHIITADQDGYKDKPLLFAELREALPWLDRRIPELNELMDFYKREYVSSAVLMAHAETVLDELAGRFKLGLVTNGRTAIQYGKIDLLRLRERFDAIVVSEEAGVKKPSPDIFRLALERIGLAPEHCLFIGDHPVNDVAGAVAAGMDAVWMKVNQPWSGGAQIKPLAVITSLRELAPLLRRDGAALDE